MHPPPWPDRPDSAQDFDAFWLVRKLPPQPFPDQDYDYGSDPRFGPPGTHWIFSFTSLVDRKTVIGTSKATELGIERVLRKLAVDLPPTGSMGWTTPLPNAPVADPVGAPMRWIHATVNAKLGDNETLTHTLNFRTAPAPDVDQDQAAIQTFADQLRDHWAAFINSATAPEVPVKTLLGTHLVYQDVTAAYLEQTAPAVIGTETVKGRPRKTFTYPRPAYLVPTQYSTFAPGVAGTSTDQPLPFEVACCVSLNTGLRGPRNRGRLYLGGLTSLIMGGNGNFGGAAVGTINRAFATFVHNMNTDTGARLHVVSRAYATSVGVNGVQVGIVPDSQRRRRRSRLENFAAPVLT